MPKFRRHNVNNRKITTLTRKNCEGMDGVVKPQQRKQFKEEETKTVGARLPDFLGGLMFIPCNLRPDYSFLTLRHNGRR